MEKEKPSLEMFLSICEYLNIAPEYFFENSDLEKNDLHSVTYMKIIESLSETQKQILADFIKSLKNENNSAYNYFIATNP